jgi:hypothetical protein
MLVVSNVVDGPNHFGIMSMARESTFQDNLISNVGVIENLGPSGLGCEFGNGECSENGGGMVLQRFDNSKIGSTNVTIRRNRVKRAGACGIETFGIAPVVEENVVDEACYSKGDCGGICTFTASNMAVRRNIVRDVISPIEGFSSGQYERFGFGLYIQIESTGNCEGNTTIRTQGYGIIYQTSTGDILNNTVYGAHGDWRFDTGGGRSLIFVADRSAVGQVKGNTMVGTERMRLLWKGADSTIGASDYNYFFQPYTEGYIYMETQPYKLLNLAEWRTSSGQDTHSTSAWFTLAEGTQPKTEIFVNDTAEVKTLTLTGSYVDLDQKAVTGSITLDPFASRVLVAQ